MAANLFVPQIKQYSLQPLMETNSIQQRWFLNSHKFILMQTPMISKFRNDDQDQIKTGSQKLRQKAISRPILPGA